MSTSIYKTENLQIGYKFATRKNRNSFEKVKRLLFGPVDHEENKNFIENQLNLEYNRNCIKWNFNFHDEITLNPDGDYIWAPPSPVRINKKRKPTEIDDSSAYYFQPIDVNIGLKTLCKTIEPIARRSPENQAKTTKLRIKQSLITDYMVQSKRSTVCSTKDTQDERPKKIPKMGDFCSS